MFSLNALQIKQVKHQQWNFMFCLPCIPV